jgi:hypothetical protein
MITRRRILSAGIAGAVVASKRVRAQTTPLPSRLAPGVSLLLQPGVYTAATPLQIATGAVLTGVSASNAPGVGVEIIGDIVVEPEARVWLLKRIKLRGRLLIGRAASSWGVEDVFVDRGSVEVARNNFLGHFENVWVDDAPSHAFQVGDPAAGTGCDLSFERCFARRAGGWGFYITNQRGLSMRSCAADVNAHGGFLFVSVGGVVTSLTTESNPIGIRAYDCPLMIEQPWDDGADSPLIIDGAQKARLIAA